MARRSSRARCLRMRGSRTRRTTGCWTRGSWRARSALRLRTGAPVALAALGQPARRSSAPLPWPHASRTTADERPAARFKLRQHQSRPRTEPPIRRDRDSREVERAMKVARVIAQPLFDADRRHRLEMRRCRCARRLAQARGDQPLRRAALFGGGRANAVHSLPSHEGASLPRALKPMPVSLERRRPFQPIWKSLGLPRAR
jgi:hypothetical protein